MPKVKQTTEPPDHGPTAARWEKNSAGTVTLVVTRADGSEDTHLERDLKTWKYIDGPAFARFWDLIGPLLGDHADPPV